MRAFFDDMFGFDDFDALVQGSDGLPAVHRRQVRNGCARADPAHHRRSSDHQGRRLPRSVHDARDVHVAGARRRSTACRRLAGLDALRRSRPTARALGLLTQISFLAVHSHPGAQLADAARQGAARAAAVPEGAAAAAQRGLLAVENPELDVQDARERVSLAPEEPGLRRLPQDHRPDGPGARELRRRRAVPRRPRTGAPIDAERQSRRQGVQRTSSASGRRCTTTRRCRLPGASASTLRHGRRRCAPTTRRRSIYFNARFAAAGYACRSCCARSRSATRFPTSSSRSRRHRRVKTASLGAGQHYASS